MLSFKWLGTQGLEGTTFPGFEVLKHHRTGWNHVQPLMAHRAACHLAQFIYGTKQVSSGLAAGSLAPA